MFTNLFASSTATDLMANVSSFVGDSGVLTIVLVVVAIPLAFYIFSVMV
jgi:hypothetical protein